MLHLIVIFTFRSTSTAERRAFSTQSSPSGDWTARRGSAWSTWRRSTSSTRESVTTEGAPCGSSTPCACTSCTRRSSSRAFPRISLSGDWRGYWECSQRFGLQAAGSPPNPLSVMCETFQVQKCLRYNDAGTFEGKVFELTAKAISACKETIQFARMM